MTELSAAIVCQRYRESMTPMMLVKFERRFMEAFGDTPTHAIPAEEAKRIYDQILEESFA